MNTPRTLALGWGSLILAAGVSFYYAKQTINERRRDQEVLGSRPTEKMDWRTRIANEPNPNATSAPPAGHVPGMPVSPTEALSASVPGPGRGVGT